MFLYEQIESAKTFGAYKEFPSYIGENLNSNFELREYQKSTFQNFITFFETPTLKTNPTQTLFHMATGSGKTLIMAGLMLYLYQQGYRNFLFFVNLDNIVKKTKDNFLNSNSSKYLFNDEVNLGGERITIKEVNNFQYCDQNAINICFTTTQGLHSDMWNIKENSVSIDDFSEQKVVLISDEAHHLNADTKKGKLSSDEQKNSRSWEYTVNRIFGTNNQNVLLEFTATCDIENPYIKNEYFGKIIFDYPLKKFREDKFSKEIKTLRSDVSIMERALQAVVLSQYRLKLFEDNRLYIKPVVLFKSAKIADGKEFMYKFVNEIKALNGSELMKLSTLTDDPTIILAFSYFSKKGITLDQLAQEIKEGFSEEKCISANEESDADANQIILNSLEDKQNPYRAIFEVRKLDEGWDVLNLFDIVRLYETRQSGGKSISSATISEAQLIGRGARYCPFKIDEEQSKHQRKYDDDIENPLRICEELYYHCQNDSRYIGELHNALIETGAISKKSLEIRHELKDDFKKDEIYKKGILFANERIVKNRNEIDGLTPSLIKEYLLNLHTGKSGEDILMEEKSVEMNLETHTTRLTIKEIADFNYSIVNKSLRKHDAFKFNTLKSKFPNLKSTLQFVHDEKYLGGIVLVITTRHAKPSAEILFEACTNVLSTIATSVSGIEETYAGTREFKERYVRDIFKDKIINFTDPENGGVGISQNDSSVSSKLRIDLSKEDWFAFKDNFGTSEEKAFVIYFKQYVGKLKEIYEKVYLLRNERQLAIYSFAGGERFEPDYLMFLRKKNATGYEQYQVFVEPKGQHLFEHDKWKEDFLLQIEGNAIPKKTFVDDNNYHIWGLPFYNQQINTKEFTQAFERVLFSYERGERLFKKPEYNVLKKVAETRDEYK